MARVLLAGVSTRAAAESAARAGFAVTAIDGFADLDQHPSVRALSLPGDFGARLTAHALARAAGTVDADAIVYLSNLENHPRAVAALASGRALWGNAPEVLRRVRDPLILASTLQRHGFDVPQVRLKPDTTYEDRPDTADAGWMVKPLRSGGGQRVRQWRGGRVASTCYLQERIEGTPGSVVFVVAGSHVVPLGVSRQLIGDPSFGARDYRYCGNILAPASDPQFPGGAALIDAACALARTVGCAFWLTGVNGVDFIASGTMPYAIEVNPRWSASMELVERSFGVSMFAAHADACARARLPAFDFAASSRRRGAVGKAIVFARREVVVGDTRAWLGDTTVRDVPHPGESFRAGQPVCTVFAADRDGDACYRALVARAARIHDELDRFTAARRADVECGSL